MLLLGYSILSQIELLPVLSSFGDEDSSAARR
jgi:hypothetical protein